MSLAYQVVPVTPFQQNCSIIWCEKTRQAAVVDPGGDVEILIASLQKLDVKVTQILLTHGHLDHVGGAKALQAKLDNVPIIGPHRADEFWLQSIEQQCQMFGFPETRSFLPEQWLEEGDRVMVGECELAVYHTPGHTPGHIIFFQAESKLALVGDVLFNGSVGRTDFPQGSMTDLINSVVTKLWPLGEDIHFVAGHGPESDFATERQSNAYVADRVLASRG